MRSGCTLEKNTGLVYDSRYVPTGLYTNLYSVQNENGVLPMLSAEPDYSKYVPSNDQKLNYKVGSWSRPTLNWSLECEATVMTREEALESVQGAVLIKPSKVSTIRRTGKVMVCLWGIVFTIMCCCGRKNDVYKRDLLIAFFGCIKCT